MITGEQKSGGAVTAPLLEMRGIVKAFPGVRALDGVDLEVRAGEVHCLLGQNGAGKSTLIKVLAGAHQPDAGEITWRGEPVRLGNPQAAMSLGVATIYQELDLVGGLTVADNIFLGREHARLGISRPARANRLAGELLTRLGHPEIRPTAEVVSLSAAAQQMVSIARALSQDAKLIIMDEPSAVLDNEEVERLFGVIRDLTAHDVAVVYISHRLEEIRQIGDRITVLKDGRTVATGLPARDTATREVITLMTGRTIEYVFPPRSAGPHAEEKPLLEVGGLTLRGVFSDISFTVRPGEIVGLAGLVGAGRTELAHVLFGLTPADAGTIAVDGRVRPIRTPADAVRLGLAYVPEDRRQHGVIGAMSVAANTSLASLHRVARFGLLDRAAERAEAQRFVTGFAIRTPSIDAPVGTLSGGNQQKVALARWLATKPRLLILDEPTQGVDIGAKAEIHRLIRALAADGLGILLISSELTELLGLAHRIGVMRGGRLAGVLDHADATEERLMSLALGHTPVPVGAGRPGDEARLA
jgi:ribose transport system ATP-binding protein